MSFTHTIGQTYKNDAGTIASVTTTTVGPAEENLEITVAASATNAEHDIAFAHAAVLGAVISSTGPLTIKTNDSTSPGDTLTLATNQAIMYGTGTGGSGSLVGTNPFSADVTKIYVTNPSTTLAIVLKIRVLLNL